MSGIRTQVNQAIYRWQNTSQITQLGVLDVPVGV